MATSVVKGANGKKLDASEYTLTFTEGRAHGSVNVVQSGAVVYVYMMLYTDMAIANGVTEEVGQLLVGGKPPVQGTFGAGYANLSNVNKPILGWVTSTGSIRITNLTGAQIPANTSCFACIITIY